MTDIIWPPGLAPRRVTWTLERAVAAFESPLSFATQRVARAGARWRASIEMPPLTADETALLSGWLDQIGRAENCGLLPVFQNNLSGTETETFTSFQEPFSAANVVADWSGARGFATGLLMPPYFQSGDLVLYSGNTTSNQSASAFPATQGLPYAAVLDAPIQLSPPSWQVAGPGISPIHFTGVNVVGRSVATWTAIGAQNAVVLYIGAGNTAFTQCRYTSLTLNRILLAQQAAVAGANQILMLGGYSATPQLAMRRGQYFEIRTSAGFELKRLMNDVDLIAGTVLNGVTVTHVGRAVFEPALRGNVSEFAAILTHRPVCRMRLAEPNSSATIDAPMFGGFAFDLVEWFGA